MAIAKKANTTVKKASVKKTSAKTAVKPLAKKSAISKDMTIAQAVNEHPETAFVMMKHGLHCVGCHVASWETIEQGAMGHGMDDKGVKTMVDEMNKAVEMMNKKK